MSEKKKNLKEKIAEHAEIARRDLNRVSEGIDYANKNPVVQLDAVSIRVAALRALVQIEQIVEHVHKTTIPDTETVVLNSHLRECVLGLVQTIEMHQKGKVTTRTLRKTATAAKKFAEGSRG